MNPQKLQTTFLGLCRDYAKAGEVFGSEEHRDKKSCTFTLICRAVRLELVYQLRGIAGAPPSTLYCRVYPDKNCPIFLHLPEVLALTGSEDYRACYFPYIETEQRMRDCFRALTDILSDHLPALEKLGISGDDRALLERAIRASGVDTMDPDLILQNGSNEQVGYLMARQFQEVGFVTRHTDFAPWNFYLHGQPEKALSAYQKRNDLTLYERSLCRFLETPEGKGFVPMPPECFAKGDMEAVTVGKQDGLTLFKCMFALYPICAAAGCLLMGVIQLISSYGTLCWFGAPWYMGLLLGGLPALFGGIALRRQIIPLINRKTSRQQLDFDDILNPSPAMEKFAIGAFLVALGFSVFFGVMMGSSAVRLYEDYGTKSDSVFESTRFEYGDIDAIYYISARHNEYGGRIDRASYVIALEDGTLIDLDGYTTVEKTEREALPIFEERGIPLFKVDSDLDLPGEL